MQCNKLTIQLRFFMGVIVFNFSVYNPQNMLDKFFVISIILIKNSKALFKIAKFLNVSDFAMSIISKK